jgi:hypothetical protein
MNLNQKILSDITIFMKYAKYLPEKNRRETWIELVDRNKQMHIDKFPELVDDIELAYKLVYDKKVLPSMRSLQFAGKPIKMNPSRIYNCFKRDTKFITSMGVKSFEDFNDGDEVVVMSPDGTWQKSKVRNYGEQSLSKFTFKKSRSEKVVYATNNHRWLLHDGTDTTSLKIGDKLLPVADTFSNFDYEESDPIGRMYWAYGYIFGDGTRVRNRNKEAKWSMVRLCGDDKTKYLSRFEELGFTSSSSKSLNGDVIVYSGHYLKTIPSIEDGVDLLRAFICGYMDADGSRQYDTTMVNKWKGIQSSDLDHIDLIDSLFETVGLFITRKEDLTGQKTNYGIRPTTFRYGMYHTFGNRPNSFWSVTDIEYNVETAQVWCLEVENTHSFVLSGGLSTGNCAYLPIDDWRSFSEVMFLLLGGTGVGFSVQNHHIEKLPEINKPRQDRQRRWLVNDSIEGWADAVKILIKSYFYGGSKINFDFSDIRAKGMRLITSGGKAPGPQPLKECLLKIEGILENKNNGEKLSSVEVHDIICHIADSVLAGGIRRAALISLFNADDDDMISCKSGNWWELNPQRGRANNSAVLLRHKITKEYFLDLWKRVEMSNAGEPGIYLTNDKDWGTNPSLRAGTKVWTDSGIFAIDYLQDKNFLVTNLDGQLSPAKCWLSGTNQKLWEITLQGGHKYYATKEHEWPVQQSDGTYVKVKTPDVISGNKFPNILKSDLGFGQIGTYDDGFLCGWHIGDGWTTLRKEGYLQHGLICTQKDGVKDKLITCLRSIGVNANLCERETWYELNTSDKDWNDFQKKFEYSTKNKGLPKTVWNTASENFRKGLIDGLFSSDGNIEIGTKRRITYTTAHEILANDVCEILGFYGIKTSIKKSSTTLNGKKFFRWDIRISGKSNIEHFRNVFKLSVDYKQSALNNCIWTTKSAYDNTTITVVSVKETELLEDVWDISVMDDTHCFQLAHSITGNCCEIALRPFQFCNLCEVNVSDIESQQDLEERVAAATLIGTIQASYTDFHYLRPIWKKTTEKDALIGVSMTGIGSGKILNYNLTEAAKVVVTMNKIVAEKIGINAAARQTTIKPAGTSSLVLGASSGIHAWHNDFYTRRIRVNKNEAIYTYLSIYHPELLEDDYFRPHDTAIICIPQSAPQGSIIRTESPFDLLERIKLFYTTWIANGHIDGQNTHNVSATVSIKEDEWDSVGEWMWENRNFYNGLSVLPFDNGSYIQAPFTDITEEEFNTLSKNLNDIDLTKVIEMQDETQLQGELACLGGNCEIR